MPGQGGSQMDRSSDAFVVIAGNPSTLVVAALLLSVTHGIHHLVRYSTVSHTVRSTRQSRLDRHERSSPVQSILRAVVSSRSSQPPLKSGVLEDGLVL